MASKTKKPAARKSPSLKSTGSARSKPSAVKVVRAKSAVVSRKIKRVVPVVRAAKPAKVQAKGKSGNVTPAAPQKKAMKGARGGHLDGKTLERIKEILIKMRDRLTGQITALSDESLKYIDDSSSEDRTDDFDREFALNLMSTEQESVFEIDSALRRIKEGTYGMCDFCGCPIEKARLQALPFARMCIKCQSASERGRARFRPFGEALEQGVEQDVPEVVEPEENE